MQVNWWRLIWAEGKHDDAVGRPKQGFSESGADRFEVFQPSKPQPRVLSLLKRVPGNLEIDWLTKKKGLIRIYVSLQQLDKHGLRPCSGGFVKKKIIREWTLHLNRRRNLHGDEMEVF